MVILGAQYYRPPFPDKKRWKEDLDKMKASGLNALQLWVVWGWVESEPGKYVFDDYDELFEEAEKRDLGVVLSTIAELQPYWIHRIIPDSHMVDNMGNKVVSSNREESNQGVTPGGCTDHPEVRKRMGMFLEQTAERYKDYENFLGWDCWNELRWNVNSDGLVCFCDYTLNAFRDWLKSKYIDLDGLNKAWVRRYCSWKDVFPGKLPNRPYTEMMEFEKFLQWRDAQHVKFRYDTIKRVDPKHIITAHGRTPSIFEPGDAQNHAMNRGNDWELADHLDGYGCSHFPFFVNIRDEEFGVRIEATRSAAAGKTVWVSELQGGSARHGFKVFPSVQAKPQQRWVWNSYARGAKAVIFWCWRDEVFGKESSGYGLAGLDGFAEERLEAMKKTGSLLSRYNNLIENYQPDQAAVGVLFDANVYNLEWAKDGKAIRAMHSMNGYLTALERIQVPYEVIESNHLEALDNIKVLFMPFPIIVAPETAKRVKEFIDNGGTLLIEGEADAFTALGFYRYPGEEREFAYSLDVEDNGRRVVKQEEMTVEFMGDVFKLRPSDFITPLKTGVNHTMTEIISKDEEGQITGIVNKVGKGTVIALGSFIGEKYSEERYTAFERFIGKIVDAAGLDTGIQVEAEGLIQWRTGVSGNTRLLFIINPDTYQKVAVRVEKGLFHDVDCVTELTAGISLPVVKCADFGRFDCEIEAGGYAVIVF